MSRIDIASYLGMSLESLSRAMTKLSKAAIISAQRSHMSLLQTEVLETLASHQL